jgi:hypothetical protein
MAKELLKEAIADAKAVREVALQNAKMALEEAFDSKIKNMLSARLAEELEEDVELEEEYMEDEKSEGMSYDEDDKVDEMSYDEDDVDEAYHEDEVDEEINLDELMAELEEMSYDEDDDMKEGKKDDDDMKEGKKKDDDDMKEGKKKDDDDMKEGKKKDDDDLKEGEQLDEMVGLAAVGSIIAAAGGIEAILKKGRAGKLSGKMEAVYKALEGMAAGAGAARRSEGVDDLDENIDIDALIAEIESEIEEGKKKDDDDMKEGKKKDKEMEEGKKKAEKDLEEALATVASLKETISEMNLLNSKLLYCNKLFRANALTEAQKVKVVDALDKSTTAGEAKLVYETLQESFAFTGVEKRAIKEGLGRASKAAGVAPNKVITESVDETVSRFQKLANIKL